MGHTACPGSKPDNHRGTGRPSLWTVSGSSWPVVFYYNTNTDQGTLHGISIYAGVFVHVEIGLFVFLLVGWKRS